MLVNWLGKLNTGADPAAPGAPVGTELPQLGEQPPQQGPPPPGESQITPLPGKGQKSNLASL